MSRQEKVPIIFELLNTHKIQL